MQERDIKRITGRLVQLLNKNPHIVVSNLKLGDLARRLKTPCYLLTKYLNQHLGKTYKVWLNDQRFKLYWDRVEKGDLRTHTIIGLATECGFRSRSNFYTHLKTRTIASTKLESGQEFPDNKIQEGAIDI